VLSVLRFPGASSGFGQTDLAASTAEESPAARPRPRGCAAVPGPRRVRREAVSRGAARRSPRARSLPAASRRRWSADREGVGVGCGFPAGTGEVAWQIGSWSGSGRWIYGAAECRFSVLLGNSWKSAAARWCPCLGKKPCASVGAGVRQWSRGLLLSLPFGGK